MPTARRRARAVLTVSAFAAAGLAACNNTSFRAEINNGGHIIIDNDQQRRDAQHTLDRLHRQAAEQRLRLQHMIQPR